MLNRSSFVWQLNSLRIHRFCLQWACSIPLQLLHASWHISLLENDYAYSIQRLAATEQDFPCNFSSWLMESAVVLDKVTNSRETVSPELSVFLLWHHGSEEEEAAWLKCKGMRSRGEDMDRLEAIGARVEEEEKGKEAEGSVTTRAYFRTCTWTQDSWVSMFLCFLLGNSSEIHWQCLSYPAPQHTLLLSVTKKVWFDYRLTVATFLFIKIDQSNIGQKKSYLVNFYFAWKPYFQ